MKICAIDSSGLVAGVAIAEDGICTAEYNIQYKVTHSQTLLPMLDEICRRVQTDIKDIDAYAVAAGPGSFTGLRIGIATVKGLGLAVDRPLAAIPTLEALAENAYGWPDIICPIMDARRSQVYTGIYEFDRSGQNDKEGRKAALNGSRQRLKCLRGQMAIGFSELCDILNEMGREVLFLGDGVPVFKGEMENRLQIGYDLAPLHMNRQKASALAALAEYYLTSDEAERLALGLEGEITDTERLTPIYLRPSQAERVRAEGVS